MVADEVRALAEQTTKATREIGEMIKSIQTETHDAVVAMDEGVREVEQGLVEAAKSDEALLRILEMISSVTTKTTQMATAAEEQTATTNENTENIHTISAVVRKTASASQLAEAAASQLSELSLELHGMVEAFKIAS